jgi:iron-sulfur cluster repair protein YtfE (RIC family)
MKEELVLFPRIKEVEQKLDKSSPGVVHYVDGPISEMETEHEHAGIFGQDPGIDK